MEEDGSLTLVKGKANHPAFKSGRSKNKSLDVESMWKRECIKVSGAKIGPMRLD
jgi:hypothetical protein